MSSWFNVEAIQGFTKDLTEKVQTAASAIPKVDVDLGKVLDKDMFEKLTLSTPELKAERNRIDDEEKRKERVRDMLADMLPWETRDKERDILVEECREAILKLSESKDTFLGPYEVPPAAVNLREKSKRKEKGADDGNDDNEDEEPEDQDDDEGKEISGTTTKSSPSKESLEKLAKLEPLPPLLRDFDFDAHVGLIQRLLSMDSKLVQMQSSLSGGGERERIFWRNYFFHCAFTRYEAGLSIDEIWSEHDINAVVAKANKAMGEVTTTEAQNIPAEEETITFDSHENHAKPPEGAFRTTDTVVAASAAAGGSTVSTSDAAPGTAAGAGTVTSTAAVEASAPVVNGSSNSTEGVDYEMITSVPQIDAISVDHGDYELDELEAEIARELED